MDNLSLSSSDPNDFSKAIKYHSTFITSLILSCLNNLPKTKSLNLVQKKAVKFLLSQKSSAWSFNYWVRNSKEFKLKMIPDDLDCTFVSLSALFEYDPKILDGKALAKVVSLLTTLESKIGGPYKTWLVDKNASLVWKDIDLAVNANIAYFLSLQNIKLPKLNKFIQSKIARDDFISPYYPSVFPVIYFISRFYQGPGIKKMIEVIQKPKNPLEAALSISSQLNFGVQPRKLQSMLKIIGKPPWKAYAFCLDPAIDGKAYYSGSKALTKAFCLEALSKYSSSPATLPLARRAGPQDNIYNQIIKEIKARFSLFSPDLKKQALLSLNKILKMKQKDQIILLPYFFSKSLLPKFSNIPNSILTKLGMANLYGWIAYTIYDNFLDEEGDPKKLPVANLALRELTTIFNTILPNPPVGGPNFPKLFQKIMDELEEANCWEVSRTRFKNKPDKIPNFGDYSKLARKSLGHALGPLAILHSLGFSSNSKEVLQTLSFFEHFIIAKQLNDDAHDFKKDLKLGHITSVAAKILKITKKEDKYQEIFWKKVLLNVCKDILRHTNLARLSIKKLDIFSNFEVFEAILLPIEKAAKKALEEQEKTSQFLSNF